MRFTLDDLTGPVRRLVRSDTAVPTSWVADELTGGYGNPATAGIHRVRGTAIGPDESMAWDMVVKIIQDPAKVGMGFLGSASDHWNYWRREAELHVSGFFDRLPDVFSYPVCFGVDERRNGDVWLWLEHVPDAGDRWTAQRFDDVAYRAGRFNGAFVAGRPLPDVDALQHDFMRSWGRTLTDVLPYLADPHGARWFWNHPGIVELFGPPESSSVRRFLHDLDRHHAALDRLPRTLCHRDLWLTNVLWPDPDRCVLIDWGLAGTGPVGEELVQLTWSATDRELTIDPMVPYLTGLRDKGWVGDETLVHYGQMASFGARVGPLLIIELHDTDGLRKPVRSEADAAALITDDLLDAAVRMAGELRRATALANEMLG